MNPAIQQALSGLDPKAKLYDVHKDEFVTGGAITNACRLAGYNESGHVTINNLNWWNGTVSEFGEFLSAAVQTRYVIETETGYARYNWRPECQHTTLSLDDEDDLLIISAAGFEEAVADLENTIGEIRYREGNAFTNNDLNTFWLMSLDEARKADS